MQSHRNSKGKTEISIQELVDRLLLLYNQGKFSEILVQEDFIQNEYPSSPVVWNILGAAAAKIEKLSLAVRFYQNAIFLDPDFADAHYNMGNTLIDQGKPEDAKRAFYRAIALKPDYADAYNNLGNTLKDQGKLDEAKDAYLDVLLINPKHVNANFNLGNVSKQQGKIKEAILYYKKTLSFFPDFAPAHNNLGVLFNDQMKPEKAIEAYKKAIELKPDYVEAYTNLGTTLNSQGKLEDALQAQKIAILFGPDNAEAFYNIGVTLNGLSKLKDAIEAYQKALMLRPNFAEACLNIGAIQKRQGKFKEAIETYEMALKMRPNYTEAYFNIGVIFKIQGRLEEAIGFFKRVLEIQPDFEEALAQKLFLDARLCDWPAIENCKDIVHKLGIEKREVQPFTLLSLEDAPERHRLRSELFSSVNFQIQNTQPFVRPSRRPDRLRVGYFSADFNEHPVAYLLARVFEIHDRDKFELFGYSFGKPKMDKMRKRLSGSFCKFRDLNNISDIEAVKTVREDKLEIAIDLTGYSENGRTGLFASRLAPVQINFLGYPGTIGAKFMDYIIADTNLIPLSSQKFYTEKPIYLPHQFQPQDDTLLISKNVTSRKQLGLPENGFVYCAINNNYKISPLEFDIWMSLLDKTEGSVLWLLEGNETVILFAINEK